MRTETKIGVIGLLVAVAGTAFAGLQYFHEVNSGSKPVIIAQGDPLAQLFSEKPLGKSIAYVEGIVGPSVASNPASMDYGPATRSYIVNGCHFDVSLDDAKVVRGFHFPLDARCTFSWDKVFVQLRSLPPPEKLTFGDLIDNGGWGVRGYCLQGECGNRTSSSIKFTQGPSMAMDMVEVSFVADIHDYPEPITKEGCNWIRPMHVQQVWMRDFNSDVWVKHDMDDDQPSQECQQVGAR